MDGFWRSTVRTQEPMNHVAPVRMIFVIVGSLEGPVVCERYGINPEAEISSPCGFSTEGTFLGMEEWSSHIFLNHESLFLCDECGCIGFGSWSLRIRMQERSVTQIPVVTRI